MSPSTSTKRPTLLETLLESVDELARARPHTNGRVKYGPLEWRAYCQGYYMALSVTIQVLELAVVRFKLRVQTHRKATLAKRSA